MTPKQITAVDEIGSLTHNLSTLKQMVTMNEIQEYTRYIERCRMSLDRLEILIGDMLYESQDTTKKV